MLSPTTKKRFSILSYSVQATPAIGYFLLCQSSQVGKIAICNAVRVKAYRVQDVGISPAMKPHEVYHQKMKNKTTARLVCLLGGFKVYIIAFILYLYIQKVSHGATFKYFLTFLK
jgi:hypothetical protein